MDKFTVPIKETIGGIDPYKWFDAYYTNNTAKCGNDIIDVIDKDGKEVECKLNDAGILFKNFVVHRKGIKYNNHSNITTHGNVGSNSVTATPIAFVKTSECWVPTVDKPKKHFLTKNNYTKGMVQPICLFNTKNETEKIKTMVLMEQCARLWVSGGDNNIDMNMQHVANMFICQQSSLIYSMMDLCFNFIAACDGFSETKIKMKSIVNKYIWMIKVHLDSISNIMEIFSDVKKPIEGLSLAEFSCDVVQKTIAATLVDFHLTTEDYLRVLELTLKRTIKRNGTMRNFFKTPLPGVASIFIFVPLYKKIFKKEIDIDSCATLLVDEIYEYYKNIKNQLKKNQVVSDVNKIVIVEMIKYSGIKDKVTSGNIQNIVEWCMNSQNRCIDAPLEKFGIIEPPTINFKYTISNLKIKGCKLLNEAKFKKDNGGRYFLIAKNPVQWSGILLETSGIYTFKLTQLGCSKFGNVHTYDKLMSAIIGFTTGKDILPTKKYMITSSGELLIPSTNDTYDYIKSLDIKVPIKVTLNKNIFHIHQNNEIYFTGETKGSKLLINFKYLIIHIEYEPNDIFRIKNRSLKCWVDKQYNSIRPKIHEDECHYIDISSFHTKEING